MAVIQPLAQMPNADACRVIKIGTCDTIVVDQHSVPYKAITQVPGIEFLEYVHGCSVTSFDIGACITSAVTRTHSCRGFVVTLYAVYPVVITLNVIYESNRQSSKAHTH
jgi:hypothetical protein